MSEESDENSYRISNEIADKFTSDPEFPFLVSFPRTGSHWLRMMMELYFEKPSLVRAFYFPEATDFTCYHRHDEDLQLERKNVIYLFRDPSATIYSQLKFYNENVNDKARIKHWSSIYAKHLDKWLFKDSFTTKKTVLTYEGLKTNLNAEFAKVCTHLGLTFDASKMEEVQSKVTKEKLKAKTKHDPRVLNLSNEYEEQRKAFMKDHRQLIFEILAVQNPEIPGLFNKG
ncbi:MAG: sulfotransferase domain-containing protein [Bacteroidota bacterium]|nr:sulfotransferase domain-containing protein [Bacteroidota bacterium]